MGRIIAGVVAGVIAFVAILAGIEFLAHQIAPSAGSGVMLALVAAAYFLSALGGSYAAAKISRRSWTIWLITLLVLVGAVWSLVQFNHPLWMQIASVVAPILGGLVAQRLFRSGTSRTADAAS